ncbi:XRE family transcriptional regulator [Streptomyces sp. V1I6]|uniref:helix-turn-helix domain-containing protein n=1 Tax=Streptomyces sp. V1I6 TaxID=3042273 RepID=UPI002784C8B3|nr:XRE family transcriptional regulator [Streptomyces sp. V1I6]MDQ0846059.1 Zn-dependent peptidase ImmA (M78 family)/transcriptional regulator with XRE-family HTH domain [Streptomyces sp. V1I6]
MDETVSDRVRRVMEAASVSQAAFAERVRLTPDKLSKSLTGVRRFTSLDLALIAEAGGTTVDWLLTGRAPSQPSFAARTTDESVPERDKVDQVAQRYAAAYEVLELLGRLPKLPALPDVRTDLALHIDQARQLAEEAARGLAATGEWATGRETDALITACAKAYGVDVAITALPDGVNGVTWQSDTFRLVLVSPSSVWTRQRFTLAHELGHILARDAQDPMVEKRIRPGRVKDLTEVRANAFASHLLMPAPEVEKRFTQVVAADGKLGRDAFARLVVEFKVSPSALAVRLGQLRLIDKDVRDRLRVLTAETCHLVAGAAAEFQRQLAWAEARQFPARIADQLFSGYTAGETTLRPLASLLGVEVDWLHDVLEPEHQGAADAPASDLDAKDPVFTP